MQPDEPFPVLPGNSTAAKGPTQINDEGALRKKAHEMIEAGKLPRRRPDSSWGGPGMDADCALCGVPVKAQEGDMGLEFGVGKYHMHARCFAAWELERYNVEVARRSRLARLAKNGES